MEQNGKRWKEVGEGSLLYARAGRNGIGRKMWEGME